MKKICSKIKCTGCSACSQICPKNAIEMKYNHEGFLYPIINERCIDCGLCVRICPTNQKIKTNSIKKVYSGYSKDREMLINYNSSGGIFTELAKQILSENGVVFGAKYDESYKFVKHNYSSDFDEIINFTGSKYIQSEIGNSFNIVKNMLNNGKRVLFTGSPCQIAGLKSFLGKEYENLLTMDFVCHGVASTEIFNKYLIENNITDKVKFIKMRDKSLGYHNSHFTIFLNNGDVISEKTYTENVFGFAFANNLINRISCSVCNYSNRNRISDITVGDYLFDNSKEGSSLIVINSDKGMEFLNSISEKLIIRELSENRLDYITHLNYSSPAHRNRKKIFANIENMSLKELSHKFFSNYKVSFLGMVRIKARLTFRNCKIR